MNLTKSVIAVVYGLVICTVFASSGFAQDFRWPENAKNLQVMSDSTNAKQLQAAMFGFVRALGVRCTYCHVGEAGQPLSKFDFTSDDKPAKTTARIMMQMTKNINQQFIGQINKPESQKLHVNCLTCHKQKSRPKSLEQLLTEVIEGVGVDAAIEKYHQLRQRYYGGFSYDFREGPLNNVGYRLMGKGDLEGALEIFKLNVEMNPANYSVYDSLGEVYMKSGNKELAIVNYKKSLELNPRNRNATKMLEQLAQQ